MTQLDLIRRDRLNHLCDLYAEAIDAVIAIMMKIPKGDDEYPEPPPTLVIN